MTIKVQRAHLTTMIPVWALAASIQKWIEGVVLATLSNCCFAWFNQRGSSALYSIRFFKVSFFFENHFCRTKSVFRESNHSSFFRAHTSSLKRLVRGSNANFCVALQRKTSFLFYVAGLLKKCESFLVLSSISENSNQLSKMSGLGFSVSSIVS